MVFCCNFLYVTPAHSYMIEERQHEVWSWWPSSIFFLGRSYEVDRAGVLAASRIATFCNQWQWFEWTCFALEVCTDCFENIPTGEESCWPSNLNEKIWIKPRPCKSIGMAKKTLCSIMWVFALNSREYARWVANIWPDRPRDFSKESWGSIQSNLIILWRYPAKKMSYCTHFDLRPIFGSVQILTSMQNPPATMWSWFKFPAARQPCPFRAGDLSISCRPVSRCTTTTGGLELKASRPLAVKLLQELQTCLALYLEHFLPSETQSLPTTSRAVPDLLTYLEIRYFKEGKRRHTHTHTWTQVRNIFDLTDLEWNCMK